MRNPHFHTPALKWLRGLPLLPQLRHAEADVKAHIVFHAEPFPFLYLLGLKRPVIYSVVSGMGDREILPPQAVLRRIDEFVVTNRRDASWLESRGFRNVTTIRPGITTAHFTCTVPPLSREFVLVAGSSPWTKRQFVTKGIETLLQAVAALPWLRIIFLWRGVLYEEMMQRVNKSGVMGRVEVINEFVEVNSVFERSHAAVLIGNVARHVKAFPHSLLEALAAGKPVITSNCIPISDYVREKSCGLSIEGVSLPAFLESVRTLRQEYQRFQTAAITIGAQDFTVQAMVSAYETLLNRIRYTTSPS
jgi:glycosyltransferase involved in cell wall biosynthesis